MNQKILNKIFQAREEKLYENTYNSQTLRKNKYELYNKIINSIKDLHNNVENNKIIHNIDDYIELINRENTYINEKFYKNGFKDGISLMWECMNYIK